MAEQTKKVQQQFLNPEPRAASQQTHREQAQGKPKPSRPIQPIFKLPTKRKDSPPSSNPKPLDQSKKSKKQPLSDPKPSNLQTTQKRKEPDSKFEFES